MEAAEPVAESVSVSADGNSVAAGRDIHFQDHRRMEFLQLIFGGMDASPPPRADSPHLADCPHCGRKWLSRGALFCPTCGYSVQMAAQTRKRRANLQEVLGTFALFGVLGVVGVPFWHALGMPATRESWALMAVCGMAAIYLGILWAAVRWGKREEV